VGICLLILTAGEKFLLFFNKEALKFATLKKNCSLWAKKKKLSLLPLRFFFGV